MRPSVKKERYSLTLPPSIKEELLHEAVRQKRAANEITAEALKEYLLRHKEMRNGGRGK